ncbi:nucleotidyltransferase domain-containing protein [Leptolyngbya sp. FACHB-541]|uniref:nucleotidyltransferase domain-containing protein n=1 Tax=Leptolyngbya sp. FACHB-541 TaxID=2692810 RepID=UPI0016864182|nr:nucleotidyltransferase domain-containing protein [Leptolyngbya sp. FACHB-541]MBD1995551.1 nucleotidyltransferase domain-containing protein [Leptolyngbya sp. FACHB-541]
MTQPLPHFIHRVVDRLQSIEGIVAIALGGSRARGSHTQKSDVDLGIYYQPENPPDLIALNQLASQLDDNHRENLITPIGEWGKWINGGGWLKIEGISVDFLYRDLAQVNRVIEDCHAGQITIDYQPGHPHGFVSSIYMGEVAIGLPLHDPDGILAALKAKTIPYPTGLKQATVNKFAWEISFSLFVAQKAIARNDVAYAAGCCFRSVACMNQVLFALNEEYLLNEKGAVAVANSFALCPQNYQQRVESAFTLLTVDADSIVKVIAILDQLERDLSQWYGDRRLIM